MFVVCTRILGIIACLHSHALSRQIVLAAMRMCCVSLHHIPRQEDDNMCPVRLTLPINHILVTHFLFLHSRLLFKDSSSTLSLHATRMTCTQWRSRYACASIKKCPFFAIADLLAGCVFLFFFFLSEPPTCMLFCSNVANTLCVSACLVGRWRLRLTKLSPMRSQSNLAPWRRNSSSTRWQCSGSSEKPLLNFNAQSKNSRRGTPRFWF